MNVFVLCTGRCGSITISQAFRHATNYTVGHETEAQTLYPLLYADDHIEVDNRLAWMLGELDERYPEARYIHLLRDQREVALSMARRPDFPGESSPGFGIGILGMQNRYQAAERIWEIKNANISQFLAGRPHEVVWLRDLTERFPALWDWAGCEGDLDAAVDETLVRYNATVTTANVMPA